MSQKGDKLAARILRAEMVRREVSYADLSELLAAEGIEASEASIRNKVSRGSFTADFFLSALAVMNVETLRLTE
ncbi:DUF6471 domain-containing protein [Erythrobacter sp. JK5]|uniref:DUF6471 domain-containing protein n=1 Tax=Erythrobacter sp. JK5 TaxID=2829500 RepID=UPI001BACCC93|nr:DUF6471 domain-containing protein [Erythrobacter sp. JK5]QUL36818.1 hypothetical protein KDC96_10355 [Erythrobacter sp. JK5]